MLLQWGGALRDDTNNGCVADYVLFCVFIDLDFASVNNNTKKPIYSHLDLSLGQ